MRFFGGAGALLCKPFDEKIEYTDNDPAFSNRRYELISKFDFAFGAYGEIGWEYMFNDMMGVNITIIGNLLDLKRNLTEWKRYIDGTLDYTSTTMKIHRKQMFRTRLLMT